MCLSTSVLEEVINGPTITSLNTRRGFSIRLLVMRLELKFMLQTGVEYDGQGPSRSDPTRYLCCLAQSQLSRERLVIMQRSR